MFKSPFSFEGRIRRTEYGLSILIYFVVAFIIGFIAGSLSGSSTSNNGSILSFVLWLPCLFFTITQGAKRCHDLGNSAWFQLIPFYGFWMLFANSEVGINKYGLNPKGIGNDVEFSFEQEKDSLHN